MGRFTVTRLAVSLSTLCLVGFSLLAPASAGAAAAENSLPTEAECESSKVREVDRYQAHEASASFTEPIDLVPRKIPELSFGTDRGTMGAYITLQASGRIPDGVYSTDFEVATVEPLSRVGESGLESTHLDLPTFTPPHIFNHRREVGFYFCVSTNNDTKAGTYTGQFNLIGPEMISTASLTQTVQLKSQTWQFLIALVLALALAAGILLANIVYISDKKVSRSRKLVAGAITLIAALLAMVVAWSKDPTWGENFWAALIALIITGFGAAGLGSTITGAAEKYFGGKEEK